jgi:hypothetical protein
MDIRHHLFGREQSFGQGQDADIRAHSVGGKNEVVKVDT